MATAKTAHCHIHPRVKLICPACQGAKTRGISSPSKAKTSAANGRLGGRPKLPQHVDGCQEGGIYALGVPTPGCPRCEYNKTASRRPMTAAEVIKAGRRAVLAPARKATK